MESDSKAQAGLEEPCGQLRVSVVRYMNRNLEVDEVALV